MKRRSARQTAAANGPLERAARAILADAGRTSAKLERTCSRAVAEAAEHMVACLESGGAIYVCGNGGSAADAQHIACELAGRFFIDRPALAVTALSTNTSSLTSIGNDLGYDQVFSRQLEGVGTPGDVLIAITTSGNSPNVLRAVRAARRLGMSVIGFTGARGAKFAAECDVALITPSTSTPRIQEGHVAMGHALCELVERALFGEDNTPVRDRRMNGGRPRGAAARRRAKSAAPRRRPSGTRARTR
jgi:D-sedoheptulose 7-phosphate isomerase